MGRGDRQARQLAAQREADFWACCAMIDDDPLGCLAEVRFGWWQAEVDACRAFLDGRLSEAEALAAFSARPSGSRQRARERSGDLEAFAP